MKYDPRSTKWSVAAMDDDGKIDGFHPVHWEFYDELLNAGDLWVGGYRKLPDSEGTFTCQIQSSGDKTPTESFEIVFITPERFIATKAGRLYRFGKKIV